MVNMSKNMDNSIPFSITPYRQDRYYYVNNGHLQKGHGIGGILKGWVNRSIPIIKTKAKSLLGDVAITGLDSVYEFGRDKLVDKLGLKDTPKITKFTNTLQTPAKSRPKKAIKRKASTASFSLNRNVKHKRPRKNISKFTKNNKTGFRKVTL